MSFRLLTAVWGKDFCDIFLRVTVRSLLATGNFPELSRHHVATYTILTTKADSERLKNDPILRALSAVGKVEFEIVHDGEFDPKSPSSHWLLWRKGIIAAKERGEIVFYIMPDVLYASGTLIEWADAFSKGTRAIFSSIPEVVLETTLEEIESRAPVSEHTELALSARDVTDLFLKHIHPYHLCMRRGSRRWVAHPEFVDYVVPGAGFVQRIMGSHPFCFDPNFFEFTESFIPLNNLDRVAFLPASAISLEPLLKFMQHYFRSWSMTDDRLSSFSWWFHYYASDANDLESRRNYVFPLPGRADPTWFSRSKVSGDFYRSQCLASRVIYRLWEKCNAIGCDRAAEILATAHYAGRLRRYKLFNAPVTVLIPNNTALAACGFPSGSHRGPRELARWVHEHCFVGHHHLDLAQQIAVTLDHRIAEIPENASEAYRAAGTVVSDPIVLGIFLIYVVDFTVPMPIGKLDTLYAESEARAKRRLLLPTGKNNDLFLINESLRKDRQQAAKPVPSERTFHVSNVPDDKVVSILRTIVSDYLADRPDVQLGTNISVNFREGGASAGAPRVGLSLEERARRLFRHVVYGVEDGIRTLLRLVSSSSPVGSRDYDAAVSRMVRKHLVAGRGGKARQASGGRTDVYRQLASEFIAQGDCENALICRREAVELAPTDQQVRQELVRELLLAERTSEASVEAGERVEIWRRLAGELSAQGHEQLCVFCRRKVVEIDAGGVQYRKELVRELLLVGRTDDAATEARGISQLWAELSNELTAQGYTDLADHCRRQAAQAEPLEEQDPIVKSFRRIQVGIGLLALRDILNAYVVAMNAPIATLGARAPAPLAFLEKVVAAQGTGRDPQLDLASLLVSNPTFAEAWLENAFCHWEAGNLVPAIESALQASRTRPRCIRFSNTLHPHAEAALLIGRCLESAGLLAEANEAYAKALVVEENQPFVRVRRGYLFWKQGLVDKAMHEFAKGMPYSYRLANIPAMPRLAWDVAR